MQLALHIYFRLAHTLSFSVPTLFTIVPTYIQKMLINCDLILIFSNKRLFDKIMNTIFIIMLIFFVYPVLYDIHYRAFVKIAIADLL